MTKSRAAKEEESDFTPVPLVLPPNGREVAESAAQPEFGGLFAAERQPPELRPQAGPQRQFLESAADIVVYGGGAGGGKSYGLLLEAARHVHLAEYGGVLFRRTYSDVTNEGGLWDESGAVYPLMGAKPNQRGLYWTFPSGASVSFAHLQHDSDIYSYQGSQMPFIGFDELTHFTQRQFFYLLSRNRLGRCAGFRPYVRATCNPDADSWVAQFVAWWIAEDGFANLERAGVLRYFYRVNNVNHWAATPNELMAKFPELGAVAPPKSVTFIPATVYDNEVLLRKDPGYLANLQSLDNIDQQRLLGDRLRGGNWKIRAEAGKVFNRSWFQIIEEDEVPAGGHMCRFWDFAFKTPQLRGDDPDWTAGALLKAVNGSYYVLDCIEERLNNIDALLVNTGSQDKALARQQGANLMTRWEIEPGSAALRENQRLVGLLTGQDVAGIQARGEKLVRAKGFGAQARGGNVKMVHAPWNERVLRHLHGQPDLPHDDTMDALVGAFNSLNAEGEVGYVIA